LYGAEDRDIVIKSAVVGAGVVAQQHLACLASLPGLRVVGVCDLSGVLAESAADRFSIEKWFTDHSRMLREVRPDVVHITTPPASHFRLARDCLNAGAHVFLEKPATVNFEEFTALQALAEEKGKRLVEDYNYLFNEPVRRLLNQVNAGELGEVVHVEVHLCLNVLDKDYPAVDPNIHNPVLDLTGGVIADFLPHLASLAYFFCGPVGSVRTLWDKRTAASPLPYDELRAILRGARATAELVFSAHSQPDAFRLTVFGSRGRATADIFENRLTRAAQRDVPRPLIPLFNALEEAKVIRRSAWRLLWRKLSGGPGAYEGLWLIIQRLYESIEAGMASPISPEDMFEVNRLVDEIKKEGNRA
jgi:predicted dehydrogenase